LVLSFAYAQLEWHNKLAAEYAAFLGLELLLGERSAEPLAFIPTQICQRPLLLKAL
jgi:hypothetical protein